MALASLSTRTTVFVDYDEPEEFEGTEELLYELSFGGPSYG